jgi:hypothetical protein
LGFCRGGEHSSFLTMGRNSMIGGLRVWRRCSTVFAYLKGIRVRLVRLTAVSGRHGFTAAAYWRNKKGI